MDALWFVAAFIVFVLVGTAVVAVLEARERHINEYRTRTQIGEVDLDVYLPVHLRPKVYDWDERGDFAEEIDGSGYSRRMEQFYTDWKDYP